MFGYQVHTAVHPTVKAEFRICSRQVLTKETTTRAYWFEHVKTGHKSDPVTGIGQPDIEKAALAWLRALPARGNAFVQLTGLCDSDIPDTGSIRVVRPDCEGFTVERDIVAGQSVYVIRNRTHFVSFRIGRDINEVKDIIRRA